LLASQRELEAAADADAVDGGHDRDRQLGEGPQRVDLAPAEDAVVPLRLGTHHIQVRAGAELPQPAAQNDRPCALVSGPAERADELGSQPRAEQVVRWMAHRQHGNRAVEAAIHAGHLLQVHFTVNLHVDAARRDFQFK
jgi:hypothetical protein